MGREVVIVRDRVIGSFNYAEQNGCRVSKFLSVVFEGIKDVGVEVEGVFAPQSFFTKRAI